MVLPVNALNHVQRHAGEPGDLPRVSLGVAVTSVAVANLTGFEYDPHHIVDLQFPCHPVGHC
jgi:hypothetical protein